MKHEWRKAEKEWYFPKQPTILTLPQMNFITLAGVGDPNRPEFSDQIGALYPVAYDLRMALKRGERGDPYEYTVYPLEGVWTTDDGSKGADLNKTALRYQIMLRQPDRLTAADFQASLERVMHKKANPWLSKLKWISYTEGRVIQAMHQGSFDEELATFVKMQAIVSEQHEQIIPTMGDYWHREIYLTDARRTAPEKAKTVLRYRLAAKD